MTTDKSLLVHNSLLSPYTAISPLFHSFSPLTIPTSDRLTLRPRELRRSHHLDCLLHSPPTSYHLLAWRSTFLFRHLTPSLACDPYACFSRRNLTIGQGHSLFSGSRPIYLLSFYMVSTHASFYRCSRDFDNNTISQPIPHPSSPYVVFSLSTPRDHLIENFCEPIRLSCEHPDTHCCSTATLLS